MDEREPVRALAGSPARSPRDTDQAGLLDYASGAIQWDAKVVGSNLTAPGQVIATGIIHTTGSAMRITGNSTPASSADTVGNVGEIRKDDNFTYVKTSTGWKRPALTAW